MCINNDLFEFSNGHYLKVNAFLRAFLSITHSATDHFTVVYSVTWRLNDSEADGDLALIKTSLPLLCKSSCSYANWLALT